MTAATGRGTRIPLVLVAAIAENGVIGRAGGLPWRLKTDLKRFRALTVGHPVVMGRKTYLSFGKPLKNRTNIVVTRDPEFTAPGIVVAPSLEAAMEVAEGDALRRGAAAIVVGGGAGIYIQKRLTRPRGSKSPVCTSGRKETRCFRGLTRRNGAWPPGRTTPPGPMTMRPSPH